MSPHSLDQIDIIGISVRTTNENNQASTDIPALWGRFISEGLLDVIPNKIDNTLYCIYTDYESDYTKPYTTILGCRVNSLGGIPEGMVGKTIAPGPYEQFVAKGNIGEGMVFGEWIKIWNSDISRAYTADFEVYGEGAKNPMDATVDIFIAIQ